jgi:hypothetical protein
MAADNVVEVDFRSLDRLTIDELTHRAREELTEVQDGFAGLRQSIEWDERQKKWERRRRRQLELDLLDERRRAYTFSDEQVVEALSTAFTGEPVSATAAAAVLLKRHDPSHAAVIRVGLQLTRLAADGRVERTDAVYGRMTCRYTPTLTIVPESRKA